MAPLRQAQYAGCGEQDGPAGNLCIEVKNVMLDMSDGGLARLYNIGRPPLLLLALPMASAASMALRTFSGVITPAS